MVCHSHLPVPSKTQNTVIESLLKLGKDLVLQYNTNSEGLQRRRVLPQTPGQQLSVAPPSKPTRTQPLVRVQPLFLPFHTGPCTTIQLFPCMYSVCTSCFLLFCSHCQRGMRLWQMETAVRCLLKNPSTQVYTYHPSPTINSEPHCSLSLSLSSSMSGLRERLKRIAREVNSRESGAGRSKPPPVSGLVFSLLLLTLSFHL